MVVKETCEKCKGNRVVTVEAGKHVACPSCGGKGYRVGIRHSN